MKGYDAGYEIYDELDDADWDDVLSGPGGYVGPGVAGARWCACGEGVSWPDGTTDEDRATLQQIQDEHEASCPAMAEQGSPRVEACTFPARVDVVFEIAHAMLATQPADLIADYLRECDRIGLVEAVPA